LRIADFGLRIEGGQIERAGSLIKSAIRDPKSAIQTVVSASDQDTGGTGRRSLMAAAVKL
jgi:hypothetical protein